MHSFLKYVDSSRESSFEVGSVSFLLQEVPHYRIAFLDALRTRLEGTGIELRVLYGRKPNCASGHGMLVERSWAQEVPTLVAKLGGLDVVWQSCSGKLRNADLIVVEQSNRLLANYLLQLKRPWSNFKLAYWGHGRNMQSHRPDGFRERLKALLLRNVDWWFAYTQLTREYIVAQGVPTEKVTVVNNSVDDCLLVAELERYRHVSPSEAARDLGCSAGAKLGLFCGQLHRHKRIGFLLQAARRIRELLPSFELMIVGDGPDRALVEEAAKQHAWIHYAGSVFGALRAKYWHAAQIAMMPGLVGLVIVDSFITQRPLVTTAYPYHSPEIAYLQSGKNGLETHDDAESYAQAVAALLLDDARRAELQRGCAESARLYSMTAMVERFASGIEGVWVSIMPHM